MVHLPLTLLIPEAAYYYLNAAVDISTLRVRGDIRAEIRREDTEVVLRSRIVSGQHAEFTFGVQSPVFLPRRCIVSLNLFVGHQGSRFDLIDHASSGTEFHFVQSTPVSLEVVNYRVSPDLERLEQSIQELEQRDIREMRGAELHREIRRREQEGLGFPISDRQTERAMRNHDSGTRTPEEVNQNGVENRIAQVLQDPANVRRHLPEQESAKKRAAESLNTFLSLQRQAVAGQITQYAVNDFYRENKDDIEMALHYSNLASQESEEIISTDFEPQELITTRRKVSFFD